MGLLHKWEGIPEALAKILTNISQKSLFCMQLVYGFQIHSLHYTLILSLFYGFCLANVTACLFFKAAFPVLVYLAVTQIWSKLAQPRAAFSWIIEVWIVQDRYHCSWLSKDGGQEECKEHDLQKHDVAQPEGNANSKNGQI